MGAIQRLGPPYVQTRLAGGVYRFEVRLTGTPDVKWVRQFFRRLGGAIPRLDVLQQADTLVFEARGMDMPACLARLDATIRAVNERDQEWAGTSRKQARSGSVKGGLGAPRGKVGEPLP